MKFLDDSKNRLFRIVIHHSFSHIHHEFVCVPAISNYLDCPDGDSSTSYYDRESTLMEQRVRLMLKENGFGKQWGEEGLCENFDGEAMDPEFIARFVMFFIANCGNEANCPSCVR